MYLVRAAKRYVIFIDDFSRFTWLYPIKLKNEVFHIFKKFKALMENVFSCKIQQFQSDNGGEYLSTSFKSFLHENDVSIV